MKLIRGIQALTERHRPSVVSIGNYDGVHLGHQHVIQTLLKRSKELEAPSTVVTFEPLAKEFFMPDSVVRLTNAEERAELLFALGVDHVLCINFDKDFAAYSPRGFVDDVLIEGLGAKYVCVGDDFRFGKDRAGDFEFLCDVGAKQGFEVRSHDTFTIDGERVSSGRVRLALQRGDFDLARSLLGRAYSISGVVTKGQQLGRTLDFPTANIVLSKSLLPLQGVYAVSVDIDSSGSFFGVANIGTRPTVDGQENRLEVHLFDFDADIYGRKMRVEFRRKIRDERKFASLGQLKAQIKIDADRAKDYLSDFLQKTSK